MFFFLLLTIKVSLTRHFSGTFHFKVVRGHFERAGGGKWCVARLIAAAAEMRRVSERRKRKRDYATTVQWMWQWQWQWHGSGSGRGEMELLRRRRWRRYMMTHIHIETHSETHTYAGKHTCDLAGWQDVFS